MASSKPFKRVDFAHKTIKFSLTPRFCLKTPKNKDKFLSAFCFIISLEFDELSLDYSTQGAKMKANNTNTAQANKAKPKGAPTLNTKQGVNSSAAFQKKVISAEQNYLQNKARFIMLKCLVELDYFNLFIRKTSSDYDSIADF